MNLYQTFCSLHQIHKAVFSLNFHSFSIIFPIFILFLTFVNLRVHIVVFVRLKYFYYSKKVISETILPFYFLGFMFISCVCVTLLVALCVKFLVRNKPLETNPEGLIRTYDVRSYWLAVPCIYVKFLSFADFQGLYAPLDTFSFVFVTLASFVSASTRFNNASFNNKKILLVRFFHHWNRSIYTLSILSGTICVSRRIFVNTPSNFINTLQNFHRRSVNYM